MAVPLRTAAAPAPLRAAAAASRCLRHPAYVLASCTTCRAAQSARLAPAGR